MGFICKQPNGKYCRFSTICDCPSEWEMTRQDYIDFCVERAIEEANAVLDNHLHDFEDVLTSYRPHCMEVEDFKTFLEKCGYDKEFKFDFDYEEE